VYALDSHRKAAAAQAAGRFDDQVVPVPVRRVTWTGTSKTVDEGLFAQDELIRVDTSLERLAALKPVFKAGGTVTAGNASPYSDGAAATMMVSGEYAAAHGLKPLARFRGFGAAGVEPDIMGVGPIHAVPKALRRAGISLDDVTLIEFNEAFASQALAVKRELGFRDDRLNVNGGAIALGHPLGATGTKLVTQLVHELGRRGGGLGLVTMCIGGGMGAAGVFEVE
jgi:acetyl-CoA acyltransferase